MRNRLLFSLVFLFSAYFIYDYFFSKKDCVFIPVIFGPADIPMAQVKIQDKSHLLEVDLGSKFPLTLRRDVLNYLKKKECGDLEGRDAMGNFYTSPGYLIDKLSIEGFEFKNVLTKEVHDDYVVNTMLVTEKMDEKEILSENIGVIGRPLLETKDLFLDFAHSAMFFCDDISDIKKWGFSLEDFTIASFDRGRTGMILSVHTDFGDFRLSLDTGSTLSFIRMRDRKVGAEQSEKFDLPYMTTEKFVIGGRDFGAMPLYLLDITEELQEIDGLLGMDFLKNHPVYIDQKHKLIYVGSTW